MILILKGDAMRKDQSRPYVPYQPLPRRSSGRGKKAAVVTAVFLLLTGAVLLLYALTGQGSSDRSYSMSNRINHGRRTQSLTLGAFNENPIMDGESALSEVRNHADMLGMGGFAYELQESGSAEFGQTHYYTLQQYWNGYQVIGRTVRVITDEQGQAEGVSSGAVELKDPPDMNRVRPMEELEDAARQYLDRKKMMPGDYRLDMAADDYVIYSYSERPFPAALFRAVSQDELGRLLNIVVNAQTGKVFSVADTVQRLSDKEEVLTYTTPDGASVSSVHEKGSQEHPLVAINDSQKKIIYVYTLEGKDSENVPLDEAKAVASANTVFGDTDEERNGHYADGVVASANLLRIMKWYKDKTGDEGTDRNLLVIQDGFEEGTNAQGGLYGKNLDRHTITGAIILLGTQFDPNEIDVLGHEYTHTVFMRTAYVVSDEEHPVLDFFTNPPDEQGAINEGTSDVFGVLIEASLTGQDPDWCIEGADPNKARYMDDPGKNGYPSRVNEIRMFMNRVPVYNKHHILVADNDYSHGYATVISHAAYLMLRGLSGKYQVLTTEELARLWYQTFYALPVDADFSQFRECMEMTADLQGLSGAKKACIQAAFDEVGIGGQTNCTNVLNPTGKLFLYDVNGDLYDNYRIDIDGTESAKMFGQDKHIHSTREVKDKEPVSLDLNEGTYNLTFKDGADPGKRKTIKVYIPGTETGNSPEDNQLEVITDFGEFTGDPYYSELIQMPAEEPGHATAPAAETAKPETDEPAAEPGTVAGPETTAPESAPTPETSAAVFEPAAPAQPQPAGNPGAAIPDGNYDSESGGESAIFQLSREGLMHAGDPDSAWLGMSPAGESSGFTFSTFFTWDDSTLDYEVTEQYSGTPYHLHFTPTGGYSFDLLITGGDGTDGSTRFSGSFVGGPP